VHLWTVDLDAAGEAEALGGGSLSAAEAARARGFHHEHDRRRYAVARAVLRWMLGRYLGASPASVELGAGPFGKPTLVAPHTAAALEFNVSHSYGRALLGFACERQIGVDLEMVRPDVEVDLIARQQFAAAEWDALRRVAPAERTRAFFVSWTRKEAYLKAQGAGLHRALSRFAVVEESGSVVVRDEDDPAARGRWTVIDLQPAPGFVGAVAVERPSRLVSLRCWSGSATG
jgi:4'-phosphopantetheinyl transferase